MKKIAILGLTLAMTLAITTPVLAQMPGSNITVSNSNMGTSVMNNVSVNADTGDNSIKYTSGTIKTGAATAYSSIENYVNTNETTIKTTCGFCNGNIAVRNINIGTSVMNNVSVKADTGDNSIKGPVFSFAPVTASITTGAAGAQSDILNVVNSSVTKIKRIGGMTILQ